MIAHGMLDDKDHALPEQRKLELELTRIRERQDSERRRLDEIRADLLRNAKRMEMMLQRQAVIERDFAAAKLSGRVLFGTLLVIGGIVSFLGSMISRMVWTR